MRRALLAVAALSLSGCFLKSKQAYRNELRTSAAEEITAAIGCPESEVRLVDPESLSPMNVIQRWEAAGCGRNFTCGYQKGEGRTGRYRCEETAASKTRHRSIEWLATASKCPKENIKPDAFRQPSENDVKLEACGAWYMCGRRSETIDCVPLAGPAVTPPPAHAASAIPLAATATSGQPDLAAPANAPAFEIPAKDLRDGIRYRSYGSAFTAMGAMTLSLAAISAGIAIAVAPSGTDVGPTVVPPLVTAGAIAGFELILGYSYHKRADDKLGGE